MSELYLEGISSISKAALSRERGRIELAAYRIAISNAAVSPTSLPKTSSQNGSDSKFVVPGTTKTSEGYTTTPPIGYKFVHEPNHPLADDQGMVAYPDIDVTKEMTNIIVATRAYEANIRAFNAVHQMSGKAAEIGARK